jgi:hypothetical protein
MSPQHPVHHRLSVHGHGVAVSCEVASLDGPIKSSLGEFAVPAGGTSAPLSGIIRSFEQSEVLRHLSPTARRITADNSRLDLFAENERFWRIDDGWGISEINLLKGQWRSWILPSPLAEPNPLVEQAVLWPMAQLLRPRGLSVIPAAAVTRDGWSALILSPFQIEPELEALIRAGYRVIGQNWTSLRQENDGRVMMLQMHGRHDLTNQFCGSGCDRAGCDAVLLVALHRRPSWDLQRIAAVEAPIRLRRAWPMPELRPNRAQNPLVARLGQRAGVFDVQLSRNPSDVLRLMELARARSHPGLDGPKASISVRPTRVPGRVAA